MNPSPESSAAAAAITLGERVVLHGTVNVYGCEIGDDTRIGAFVEIQRGARVGRRCKISSHSFICAGVTLEDEVFIGHGVNFTNDPRAALDLDEGADAGVVADLAAVDVDGTVEDHALPERDGGGRGG
jgi:UDP-3-O-[3-hydroxymyristoyl] glucosamine N-acyltransferase